MVNLLLPASAAAAFAAQAWDFVVVGGGTAGIAVATRLSENSAFRIAVLEAGPDRSNDPAVTVVGNWPITFNIPQFTWNFSTVPQANAGERIISQPRGFMVGGSSGINGLEWRLASKPEYDAFAAFGNPGWDYNGLLPYFKKAQNVTPQPDNPLFPGSGGITPDKGTTGPIQVSMNLWYSSLTFPWLKGLSSLGFKQNPDPESGNSSGIANIPRTANNADGTRQYSAVTYLPLATGRNNIQVLSGAQATKIHFKNVQGLQVGTAVDFVAEGKTFTIMASKEIILSAGVFQSPHLLELSGIGKKSILSKFGIPQLLELPVGENLMDHPLLSLEYSLTPQAQNQSTLISVPSDLVVTDLTSPARTMTGTPMLWTSLQSIANPSDYQTLINTINSYLASSNLTALERVQFQIQHRWLTVNPVPEAEFILASFPGLPGLPLGNGTFVAWMPASHVHPLSRGSVHIASSDPLVPPAIDPNYLARDYDVQALLQIVQFTNKLTNTSGFVDMISGSFTPPPDVTTTAQITDWIKANFGTQFHPAGTVPMAAKQLGGVVDPNLVVYGTRNVRVIDASIMPMIVGATIQATVYAIAEKGADIIKSHFQQQDKD